MLIGVDIVAEPLAAAQARCAGLEWVCLRQMQVPGEWPDGRFDLIVLSEVLYFLSPEDLAQCARRVVVSLLPDGVVLLVNWLGRSDDPITGDEAAEQFISASGLCATRQERTANYRLEILQA